MAATGFQTSVNLQQAPAFEGDFSSANPRYSSEAGQGAFVAGVGGVTIGRFAWEDSTSTTLLNTGSGQPTGFIHREQGAALMTQFLGETNNVIPVGFMVTAFKGGEFWARNVGTSAVTKGMKVFVSTTTGQVQAAATGATVAGYLELTKWYADSACLAGELFKITSHSQG